MGELKKLTIQKLLQQHASIASELRSRGVSRTANNPLGDTAEYIFHSAFGWKLEPNSKAGFDAICPKLGRVQIKSRRVTEHNKSRQAGDIRKLDNKLFDHLAGVVFDADYEIHVAMIIPHSLILKRAIAISHSNSSRIYLRDEWLAEEGVKDVTVHMRKAWAILNAL
jgi:hypothetical protein